MSQARIPVGHHVQWHSGHGTGVVYTAVVVDPSEGDARPADDTTAVRVLALEAHTVDTPSLPLFGGRPLASTAIGTVRHIPTSRLRPVSEPLPPLPPGTLVQFRSRVSERLIISGMVADPNAATDALDYHAFTAPAPDAVAVRVRTATDFPAAPVMPVELSGGRTVELSDAGTVWWVARHRLSITPDPVVPAYAESAPTLRANGHVMVSPIRNGHPSDYDAWCADTCGACSGGEPRPNW